MPFANARRLRRSESASCGERGVQAHPPEPGENPRREVGLRASWRPVGQRGTRERRWCGEDSPALTPGTPRQTGDSNQRAKRRAEDGRVGGVKGTLVQGREEVKRWPPAGGSTDLLGAVTRAAPGSGGHGVLNAGQVQSAAGGSVEPAVGAQRPGRPGGHGRARAEGLDPNWGEARKSSAKPAPHPGWPEPAAVPGSHPGFA